MQDEMQNMGAVCSSPALSGRLLHHYNAFRQHHTGTLRVVANSRTLRSLGSSASSERHVIGEKDHK